jgi:hypothetical protein
MVFQLLYVSYNGTYGSVWFYWLKLLPAVMSFVPGRMFDGGMCYRCLFLRIHWSVYSLFVTWYEHSVELERRSMVSFAVMCKECQGKFQNEFAAD